jgi:CheY-like chemotaxis protein
MVSKKKIMVVDDEENLLILVENLLRNEGYDVVKAFSGKECLSKLKKTKPDLILLDIMMSGMTGIDVAETIRRDPGLKGLKIIFLTVVKSNEVSPAALKDMKAIDYITKPFDNNELLRRVKWALMK